MLKNPDISVIVAVYNTQNYLRRCLESIKSQTFKMIEVILVNDGSTDGSEDICREFAREDDRFILVTIEHSGVSFARNLGIQYATGHFITFVDSDDYLNKRYCEKLLEAMAGREIELAVCQFAYDYGTKIKINDISITKATYTLDVFYDNLLKNPFSFYFGVVWNKLFVLHTIRSHDIRFDIGLKVMEDWDFILKYIQYVANIASVNEVLYYYNRANADSVISRGFDFQESYVNRQRGYEQLIESLKRTDRYAAFKNRVGVYWLHYVVSQLYKVPLSGNKRQIYSLHKEIRRRQKIKEAIHMLEGHVRLSYTLRLHWKYGVETLVQWIRQYKSSLVMRK